MMASARTITITLAAVATLSVAGCKKDTSTTNPDEAPVDTDDAEGDVADREDAVDDSEDDAESADAPAMLTKASFDETIGEHFQEVSDCYVAALEGNAELQGTLIAEFTIDGEGKVTKLVAADGSSLNDEGLVACIDGAAANWAFDIPPDGEMTLRYNFQLAPG